MNSGPVTSIAVLCCHTNSVYKQIPGLDCYDYIRNALEYTGHYPIIAHPPCGMWSAHLSHQYKGDRDKDFTLAAHCINLLRRNGGVLEQPANTRMFKRFGLPLPGERFGGLETHYVWQSWWGYPTRKKTWLCFSKVKPAKMPFNLLRYGNETETYNNMSHVDRAKTTLPFAEWLVKSIKEGYREQLLY